MLHIISIVLVSAEENEIAAQQHDSLCIESIKTKNEQTQLGLFLVVFRSSSQDITRNLAINILKHDHLLVIKLQVHEPRPRARQTNLCCEVHGNRLFLNQALCESGAHSCLFHYK